MKQSESVSFEKSLRELRKSSSKQYTAFLVIFIICILFFFTSTFWMPLLLPKDVGPISEIGESQSVTQNDSLTLQKWILDPKTRQMEITFSASANDVATSEYVVEASTKYEKSSIPITAKSFGGFENIFYVVINDVPSMSETVSVSISDGNENGNARYAFFTTETAKTESGTITGTSEKDYRVAAIESVLADVASKIEEQNQLIADAQKSYSELETEIQKLELEKEYQTTDEQQSTTSEQTYLRNRQSAMLNQVATAAEEIDRLTEKQTVMTKKRDAVQRGELQ